MFVQYTCRYIAMSMCIGLSENSSAISVLLEVTHELEGISLQTVTVCVFL